MYYEGRSVRRSVKVAAQLFEIGCKAGDAVGCSTLAYIHEQGEGEVPQDLREAARLYKVGCDGGFMAGCTHLAQMYLTGSGIRRNQNKARQLLNKACEGGDREACEKLEELN